MDNRSEKVRYVEQNKGSFVASINKLAGFSTCELDVEEFLHGYYVTTDISGAKGIIRTQCALDYIIGVSEKDVGVTGIHVDMINKMLSGDYSEEHGTTMRVIPIPAGDGLRYFPVCSSSDLDRVLYNCVMSSTNRSKVNIVSEFLKMLPYKYANIRTAILTLDSVLLYQFGLFLDTREIDYMTFRRLTEDVQAPNGSSREMSNLLLSNLI